MDRLKSPLKLFTSCYHVIKTKIDWEYFRNLLVSNTNIVPEAETEEDLDEAIIKLTTFFSKYLKYQMPKAVRFLETPFQ